MCDGCLRLKERLKVAEVHLTYERGTKMAILSALNFERLTDPDDVERVQLLFNDGSVQTIDRESARYFQQFMHFKKSGQ